MTWWKLKKKRRAERKRKEDLGKVHVAKKWRSFSFVFFFFVFLKSPSRSEISHSSPSPPPPSAIRRGEKERRWWWALYNSGFCSSFRHNDDAVDEGIESFFKDSWKSRSIAKGFSKSKKLISWNLTFIIQIKERENKTDENGKKIKNKK